MRKILPPELPEIAATLQALDNQWVPRAMLDQMVTTRGDLGEVARERGALVKEEFIRGLVNLQSVILNRASLFNTQALLDYLHPEHDERVDLARLFNDGVLIPFLYREDDIAIESVAFAHSPENVGRWNDFCREADAMRVLRLSWDNDENDRLVRSRLGGEFHRRLLRLSAVDSPAALAAEVCRHGEDEVAFSKIIRRLALACLDEQDSTGNFVQREFVYNNFVVRDGTKADIGAYDDAKPFGRAIKECADLIYNSNLPDAIGRYSLTPAGSPSRSILQELSSNAPASDIAAEQVLQLLRSATFDLVQGGLYLDGFAALTLGDVRRLRETEAWHAYILAQKEALRDPRLCERPDILNTIYRRYLKVVETATAMMDGHRHAQLTKKWEPLVELVLEVAGITAVKTLFGGESVWYSVAEIGAEKIAERGAPVVIKLVIKGIDTLRDGSPARKRLENSIVVMNGKMTHAHAQLAEIARKLKEDPKFSDARTVLGRDLAACRDEMG